MSERLLFDAGGLAMTTEGVHWIPLDKHPKRQTKALLGRTVRLTKSGIEQGLQGRAKTIYGKVSTVYGLTGEYIMVKRRGTKTALGYAASFWEAPQIARPTSEERLRKAAATAELTECERPHLHWHYRGDPVDSRHPYAALTPTELLALLDRLDQLTGALELAFDQLVSPHGGLTAVVNAQTGDTLGVVIRRALRRLDSDTPATAER